MSIDLSGLPTSAGLGQPYTGTYVCRNANAPATTAIAASCVIANLPTGLTSICAPTPPASIAPGAAITCLVSGTPTTLGSMTANGTTGASNDPNLANNTGSRTIAVVDPVLTVLKTSTSTGFTGPGVVVPYAYRVTNSGTVPIIAPIIVFDDRIASVSCPALPPAGLAPAAFINCTASYTTTQADVDAGGVTNNAFTRSGTTTSPTVALTVPSTRTPALTTVKSTPTPTFASVGTIIPYSYRVTNTGNTTLTSAVTVTDDKIASVSCPALPPTGLAPGAFITCTASYTTTQTDLDAGSITNNAFARSGTVQSPTVAVTVNATLTRRLAVTKSSSTTSFAAPGVVIPYSYRVTNTGNTTLTSAVAVTDDKIASVSCPALPPTGLAPGAFITCSANYTTTQADVDAGSIINTASAQSGTTTAPNVSLTIPATRTPAMTVLKSTTAVNFASVGTIIPYSYRVTNTGNTTLTSAVTVTDDKIPSVTCPALPVGGLAPAQSITCTASYAIAQADIDLGRVTNNAFAQSGGISSPSVSLSVNATQTSALTIAKTSTATTYRTAGEVISYSYGVTNTGNTTLRTAVTVVDDRIPSVTCPPLPVAGLAPGATLTCMASYTTTQADVDTGSITNAAFASSGPAASPTVSLTTVLTINATQVRSISLVKSSISPGYRTVGTLIPYTYTLTNTGNVTLPGPLAVADDRIATVACPGVPAAGLAPNATLVCTADYTTTQPDLDAGIVTNIAQATLGPIVSPPATFSVRVNFNPNFTLTKTTTTPLAMMLGNGTYSANFDIGIQNTGDVDLADVVVSDDYAAYCHRAPVSSPAASTARRRVRAAISLRRPIPPSPQGAPGDRLFTGYTASRWPSANASPSISILSSALAPTHRAVSFDNRAVASTIFNRGTLIAQTATRTGVAPVDFAPETPLQMTKTTPRPDATVGELVPYTITVRNPAVPAQTA